MHNFMNLEQTPDNTLNEIIISGLIEEIPHIELIDSFLIWTKKLARGGKLSISVLNLMWLAEQIIKFEKGQLLTGYYCDFDGERGLQNLLYGEGKVKQCGFTKRSLYEWLDGMGYVKIHIEEVIVDDIGYLNATCIKP